MGISGAATATYITQTVALLMSIGVILLFAVRFVDHASRSRPVEPDLAAWMSSRFVAKSWNYPKQLIFIVVGGGQVAYSISALTRSRALPL